jgi:hypothetical protein
VKVSPPLVRPQPHPHPQPHLYPQRTLASSKIRTGSSNRRLPALTPGSEIRYYFLPQRAAAALRAISWRCSFVRVRPAAEVGAPGCISMWSVSGCQGFGGAGPVEAKPSQGFSPTPPLPTQPTSWPSGRRCHLPVPALRAMPSPISVSFPSFDSLQSSQFASFRDAPRSRRPTLP